MDEANIKKVSEITTSLSEFIKESFGSNATYVEGLLERYQNDPKLVDESWQAYFGDLLSGGMPSVNAANDQPVAAVKAATETPSVVKAPVAAILTADTEPKALTGVAKKIVENMEQSLTVPTATSFRNIPVKVLEENRRIINEHLASQGRGKVSFTHIIAWAIVQSVKAYPHLNFGYGVVNGAPSRVYRHAPGPDRYRVTSGPPEN